MTQSSTIRVVRIHAERLTLMDRLLSVFSAAFDDGLHYDSRRPSAAYLRKLLSRDDFIALVAVEQDKVIGGLVAYVLTKFEQERSEIYIYDLAVLESHRRRGIATALIRELQALGGTLGAYAIYVQADRGDDPAIALYSKLGMREEVLHFDFPIISAERASPR
jgi:aminoglycoside 3-N-acetyltransferase I